MGINGSMMWDGESLTYGYLASCGFPNYFAAYTGVSYPANYGWGGEPIAPGSGSTPNMIAGYPGNIAPNYNAHTCNVLHVLGGINDVGLRGETDLNVESAIQTYCGLARATGYKVYVSLCHQRGDFPGFGDGAWTSTMNTYILNYNAWMRNNWQTFCDGILDPFTSPEFISCYNPIFFQPDFIHWSDYTHRLCARKLVDLFNMGPTRWWVPQYHSSALYMVEGSKYNYAGTFYNTSTGGSQILAPTANVGSALGIWNLTGTMAAGAAINGYATLNFTGSQALTQAAFYNGSALSFTRTGNVTVVAVLTCPSNAYTSLVSQGYTGSTTGWVVYPRVASGSFNGATINTGDSFIVGGGTSTSNSYEIATCGWDANPHIFVSKIGTSNIVRFDGTSVYDVSRSQITTNTNVTAPVIIGNDGSGEFFTGHIAFLAVLGDVGLGEIQQFEGWAAWKYGLSANLPSGHPYKTQAPTVQNLLIQPSIRFC